MKKHMIIVGCEEVTSNDETPDDSIFKIVLSEINIIKQKIGLMDMAKGNLSQIMSNVAAAQRHRDIVYITLGEWRDKQYMIGGRVTLEMLPV